MMMVVMIMVMMMTMMVVRMVVMMMVVYSVFFLLVSKFSSHIMLVCQEILRFFATDLLSSE